MKPLPAAPMPVANGKPKAGPDITVSLAETARSLGAAGVGIYPEHRFVHVDVRARPYYWRASAETATAPLAP